MAAVAGYVDGDVIGHCAVPAIAQHLLVGEGVILQHVGIVGVELVGGDHVTEVAVVAVHRGISQGRRAEAVGVVGRRGNRSRVRQCAVDVSRPVERLPPQCPGGL